MKNVKSYQKIIAIVIITAIVLGSLVPQVVLSITIKEEEDLSRQMMAAIYKHFDLIEDPVVVDYVNNIGNRILATRAPAAGDLRMARSVDPGWRTRDGQSPEGG